jgi:hypothetical protein
MYYVDVATPLGSAWASPFAVEQLDGVILGPTEPALLTARPTPTRVVAPTTG